MFFSINLHKHRVAGKPFVFGRAAAGGDALGAGAAAPAPTIITTQPEESTESKAKEPGIATETAEKTTGSDDASKADGSTLV